MDVKRGSEPAPMKSRTTVERKSERELVVTRTFNGPARIVFEAWTKPELFTRWWAPKPTGVPPLPCGRAPSFRRDAWSCRGQVPIGVRPRGRKVHGVLRHVHRGDSALAPRLDER